MSEIAWDCPITCAAVYSISFDRRVVRFHFYIANFVTIVTLNCIYLRRSWIISHYNTDMAINDFITVFVKDILAIFFLYHS
jgi:hypothetical protein